MGFDERILGSSEFVHEALARAESEVTANEIADSSEIDEFSPSSCAGSPRCGTTPRNHEPSHRPAAVTGRALVSSSRD